jgi:Leucine-rich repeat (LRR) protein
MVRLKKIGTLIACATALVVFLTGALRLYDLLAGSPWRVLVALLTLAIVFLGVFQFLRSQESKLEDPERLRLDPTKEGLILGRSDALEKLVGLCNTMQVIVVEGAAGAGKTALLRAGLIPALERETPRRLIPLIVDRYSADWETGPTASLRDLLEGALPPSARSPIGFTTLPAKPSPGIEELCALVARSGVRPIFVFDNFDEYLFAHVNRLMPQNAWMTSAELAEHNSFWAQILHITRAGKAKGLFIVRSEHADLVESLFLPAASRGDQHDYLALPGLDVPDIQHIVTAITAPPGGARVIADPEAGWHQLSDRLCSDLVDASGLPGDLVLALRALPTLKTPTLRRYRAGGELKGMVAAHLLRRVHFAAMQSKLLDHQVLKIVHALCDSAPASREAGGLTVVLESVVYGRQVATPVESEALRHVLRSLREDDIVKEQLDPRTGAKSWSPYSKLIGAAISTLVPGRTAWQIKLDSYAADFKAALSPLEKSGRLLPIPLQGVLLAQRLTGKVRYGAARGFALLSLLRMLPWLFFLVVAAAMLGRAQQQSSANLFRSWRLPLDLIERQDQLGALRLNREVSKIDWLHDNLRRLDLSRANIDDNAGGYPQRLESLDVSYTQVTSLSQLPRSLRELNLGGLSHVKTLAGIPPNLRALRAVGSGVVDFSGLPASIEELEIGGSSLASLERQLPALPHLVSLKLDHSGITTLQGLPPSVKKLALHMDPLENPDFHLKDQALPALTDLVLDGVPDVDLARLPRSLLTLELGNISIPDLAGMPPNLQKLTINGYIFSDRSHRIEPGNWQGLPETPGAALHSLVLIDLLGLPPRLPPSLRELILYGDGDVDLASLHSLTRLQVVGLGWSRITDLSKLPTSVRRLSLQEVDVRDLGEVPDSVLHLAVRWAPLLAVVKRLPRNLQSLQLLGCPKLTALSEVPLSLLSLDVGGTPLERLPHNLDRLLVLDMRETSVPDLVALPPNLSVVTVSPGLRSLHGLPSTVTDLRFEERALREPPKAGYAPNDAR